MTPYTQRPATVRDFSDRLSPRTVDHEQAPRQFDAIRRVLPDLGRAPEPRPRQMELRRVLAKSIGTPSAGVRLVVNRRQFFQARQTPAATLSIAIGLGALPIDVAAVVVTGPLQATPAVAEDAAAEIRPAALTQYRLRRVCHRPGRANLAEDREADQAGDKIV